MKGDWRTNVGSTQHGFHHHAYLLYGSNKAVIDELLEHLYSVHNLSVQGNPDLWHARFESFGIDEGRSVKALHTRKAVTGNVRVFIIETRVITGEAQNALLKMFEEPTPGSYFFIVMHSVETLLPTLRSRLLEIHVGDSDDNDTERVKDMRAFYTATASERMKFMQDIIDDGEYRIPRAIAFVDMLIAYIHKNSELRKSAEVLQDLTEQRSYLQGRSPSVKMILQHIALTLPEHMAK